MINYIQVNQEKIRKVKMITNALYKNIDEIIRNDKNPIQIKVNQLLALSITYQCKPENIIKKYLNYKIYIEKDYDDKLLKYSMMIMHNKYSSMMLNRICCLYM